MAEIRQLTNIIHQLEKKLGVESGHYIRLQLEKDSLRDKLDRIKGNEISGRKSPLSSSKTDLSSDLSMFSFPAVSNCETEQKIICIVSFCENILFVHSGKSVLHWRSTSKFTVKILNCVLLYRSSFGHGVKFFNSNIMYF